MRSYCLLLFSYVCSQAVFQPAEGQPTGQAMSIFNQYPASTMDGSTEAVTRANDYRKWGDWFRQMPQFNHDSTVIYYDRALQLLQDTRPQPTVALAETYAHVAEYYQRIANFEKARQLADAGWQLTRQTATHGTTTIPEWVRYGLRRTQAFVEIGENKPKAGLPLLLEAVAILQHDNNPETQARLQKDKGLFYARFQDKLATKVGSDKIYLHQSRRFYETHFQAKYALSLYDIYRSLIWTYNITDQPDSCIVYYAKVKALLPILQIPETSLWYYAYRANTMSRQQQYAKARPLIAQALALCNRYRITYSQTYPFALNLMGVVLREEGDYDQAMTYFLKARDAAIAIGTPNVQHDFLIHMIDLHRAKGDYKKALDYAEQYADEVQRLTEKYSLNSLHENELKISLLEKEAQLTRQQVERQRFITGLVVAGLLALLLAVIGLGLYRRNLHRQRTNQQLAALNADLAKRNAENELLLKEIHHRVKNNLEVVSSLLELQSAHIHDPDVQQVILTSQNRVQSMGILHQKLYQSEHLAFIEMKQYFQNLSENILDAYNAADRVTVECPMPELALDVDTAVPVGLIVNELLSNALKYAFPKGQAGRVRLSLEEVGQDQLRLSVADNGVGKLLHAQAQGTGFGTQLVDLLTRQLEGILRQDVREGTTISIEFKKARLA